MNWDRVEAARRRGRALLMIAGLATLLAVFLLIEGPRFGSPMFGPPPPEELVRLSLLVYAIGAGGVIFGLAWMWRIYKAPTKDEGAHWRFRDH